MITDAYRFLNLLRLDIDTNTAWEIMDKPEYRVNSHYDGEMYTVRFDDDSIVLVVDDTIFAFDHNSVMSLSEVVDVIMENPDEAKAIIDKASDPI